VRSLWPGVLAAGLWQSPAAEAPSVSRWVQRTGRAGTFNFAATSSMASCIACKQSIPDGAALCSHCGSYQARWRNELRYLASTIGIGTVASALLVYSVSALPALRRQLFWRDRIEVLAFSSVRGLALANTGDGPVFVTHLTVESSPTGRYNILFPIETLIRPGEVITKPPRKGDAHLWSWGWRKFTDSLWQAAHGTAGFTTDKCWNFSFFIPSDQNFRQYSEFMGDGFRTVPAHGYVHLISLQDGRVLDHLIDVRTGIQRNPSDACSG
jgi:hypothetical protein